MYISYMGYRPERTRLLILPLLLALLFASLSLPAAAQEACLRLGTDEWPPYEYTDGEAILGMSTDIVQRVLERSGVCVESLEVYPWKRGLRLLQEGSLDLLFTADYRPSRLAWAHYPDESIVDSGWVVYVRRDRKDLAQAKGLEDLQGQTLGTVIGFGYPTQLVLFLSGEVRNSPVSSDELNFRRLEAGRIDALVCDRYNGAHLARQLKLDPIVRPLPEEIAPSRLYPLFSRKTVPPELVQRFTATLRAFKKSSEYQKLIQRWLSQSP
ncbi:MAG: transporter substrate-binding domain-containing protein [Desulfovibrio sp.]|nr:transporter substrate-binding domain-containing protein [Desulfovibrio sp.]